MVAVRRYTSGMSTGRREAVQILEGVAVSLHGIALGAVERLRFGPLTHNPGIPHAAKVGSLPLAVGRDAAPGRLGPSLRVRAAKEACSCGAKQPVVQPNRRPVPHEQLR